MICNEWLKQTELQISLVMCLPKTQVTATWAALFIYFFTDVIVLPNTWWPTSVEHISVTVTMVVLLYITGWTHLLPVYCMAADCWAAAAHLHGLHKGTVAAAARLLPALCLHGIYLCNFPSPPLSAQEKIAPLRLCLFFFLHSYSTDTGWSETLVWHR